MTGSLPSGPRIDRGALERIIRRAAELQASETDIGDGLTEPELLALGQEVGIGDRYLRQALLEERTRAVGEKERGVLTWLAGPRRVAAARMIPRPRRETEAALQAWMDEGELLQVKRRYPDQTSWEAQQGAFAHFKRAFGTGGRRYTLARAREIAGEVAQLDEQRCQVQLVADLGNALEEQLSGAAVLGGAGAAATGVALVLGVMLWAALAPVVITLPLALAVARRQRQRAEATLVALEQVLDRLEHGEVDVRRAVAGPRASAFVRMADEIRRALGA
jgi:hypothetical protein